MKSNVDSVLVGECETQEETVALWKARSWKFKSRRTWNVLDAFLSGSISGRSCFFALRYPAFVVAVAIKPSRGPGMVLVCPAAHEIEFPTSDQAIQMKPGLGGILMLLPAIIMPFFILRSSVSGTAPVCWPAVLVGGEALVGFVCCVRLFLLSRFQRVSKEATNLVDVARDCHARQHITASSPDEK